MAWKTKAILSEGPPAAIDDRFMCISQRPEKKYADRLNLEFARIESEALKGFTEAETQQLQELLGRVYENMVNIQKKEGTNK